MHKRSYVQKQFLVFFLFVFPILILLSVDVQAAWETKTDRMGMDYKSYWISRNTESFVAVQKCEQSCKDDGKCKAFTYVRPGVQGADARCYLKSGIPSASKNDCCTSGIVRPATKADRCAVYAQTALQDYQQFLTYQCGVSNSMWSDNYKHHYAWCMNVPPANSDWGTKTRKQILEDCKKPSTSGDLGILDWCYRLSDHKISFHPIVTNAGNTRWQSAKKGIVRFGCSVHNSPNLLTTQANIDLREWPKSTPLQAGESRVMDGGCSWDFPMWNSADEYRIDGWILEHSEDRNPANNRVDHRVGEFRASEISAGDLLHKECRPFHDYSIHGPNLWAQGIEVTQAIQEWVFENAKPRISDRVPEARYPDPRNSDVAAILVKGRSTVVRLYGAVEPGTSSQSVADVDAALHCYVDSGYRQPCPGVAQIKPKGRISIDVAGDLHQKRLVATKSWNFLLPEEWLHLDRIWLEGIVNTRSKQSDNIVECLGCFDLANRIRIGNVVFLESPDFSRDIAEIVAIKKTFGKHTSVPTQAAVKPFLDFVRKTYPVDEDSVGNGFNQTLAYTQQSADHHIECSLLHPYLIKNVKLNGKKAAHAFVAADYPCAGRGGGKYAFSTIGGESSGLSHELGHALGILHPGPAPGHGSRCLDNRKRHHLCAECQNNSCEQGFPWPHGTIGGVGFDVLDPALNSVYVPELLGGPTSEGHAHDFMSYGGNLWISQRNWTRLYNAMMGVNYPYRVSTKGKLLNNIGGKCLDIRRPEEWINGGGVQIWSCHGGQNQRWKLIDHALVNDAGLCLDIHAADLNVNGASVQVWECNRKSPQQWMFQGGALRNANGKCLDVHRPDIHQDGGKVQVWDCNGEPQQQWVFK